MTTDNLMPFEPMSTYYLWFLRWKEHVRAAHSCRENEGYCRAAVLAQAEFLCAQAIRLVELKNQGILKDE